ncbi:MAG: hypothetical protein GXP43_01860 [bacterium]|nr:hypothetical protein [bacterium]
MRERFAAVGQAFKGAEQRAKGAADKAVGLLVVSLLTGMLLAGCGGGGVEGNDDGSIQSSNTPVPPAALSTDWRVCATIRKGEGVVQALKRVSVEHGGGAPHEWSSGLEQRIVITYKDGRKEVYTWPKLLEENPPVPQGAKVCDIAK